MGTNAGAGFAGDEGTRKSTNGHCALLHGVRFFGMISWMSKPQSIVALSTAEAEIIARLKAVKEVFKCGCFSRNWVSSSKGPQSST